MSIEYRTLDGTAGKILHTVELKVLRNKWNYRIFLISELSEIVIIFYWAVIVIFCDLYYSHVRRFDPAFIVILWIGMWMMILALRYINCYWWKGAIRWGFMKRERETEWLVWNKGWWWGSEKIYGALLYNWYRIWRLIAGLDVVLLRMVVDDLSGKLFLLPEDIWRMLNFGISGALKKWKKKWSIWVISQAWQVEQLSEN